MRFAFAFDGNVVQHLAVTLLSVFEAHQDVEVEVFFVLVAVPHVEVNRIDQLCRGFSNVTAHYYPYTIQSPNKFPISGHITLAAYARIFLADLLPQDWSKVLYLDCDLIVRCSFAEIWALDLDGFAAAGVREPGTLRHADLGIPSCYPYINSGVLLVNLAYWRHYDVKNLLLSFICQYPEKLRYWDQDAINACLHAHLLQLPDQWNVTHTFYLGPYRYLNGIRSSELVKLLRNPAVVHFSGPTKPWLYIMTHPFQREYWEILARTPFKHVSPEKRTVRSFVFRQLRLVHRSVKRSLFIAYSAAAERSGAILATKR